MNLGETNDSSRVIAGNFTMTAQLPNGKSLNIAGYLFAGEGEDDFNQKLDFTARAIDRQRLIAEVPELEAKLQQLIDAREQMLNILGTFANVAKAGGKLSSQQKSSEKTAQDNIKTLDKQIARGEEAVQKARDAVAKVVALKED